MKDTILVGLVGKRKVGKDTLFKFVQELYPSPDHVVKRFAFGDALKKEIADACGVSLEFIEQNKETFRPMLQWWGTDFRYNLFSKNYWIDKVNRQMMEYPQADILVVTDVRRENEAQWIREKGGYLVAIVKEHPEHNGSVDLHITERELTSIQTTCCIVNMGSLTEYRNLVAKFMVDLITLHKERMLKKV